ncbi:SIR2 family NAD-dependent protein deacetylase [Ignavibacterium album JCM 16511]|uniref:NAD-dependent protein deacylase n=1 Tax=Ignavibacterium album (strain DSM 19864 / JCM 16511 / NBRC 101810 / Mat9-16) TaxID=945713 RepID=I0AGE1_IGNAJ|nr:NAD-dependent deacylase [Ignavibacterium album]AFH48048.1 SIR2 family NAD-dependent protein deacetylase [Ignavibacterium album JCM 16511]
MSDIKLTSDFINKISESEKIVFFTGAGISAESGIPTFRGKDGIWNKLKPEELANFNAFLRNPKMVWEWYNHRKKIIHESKPNAGHFAIAEFEKYFDDVVVVTQNIDNLHRRAGSNKIYELHGNIERNYCINCRTSYNEELDFSEGVPKCKCGGLIRPDVVWFGEFLPADQLEESEKAAIRSDIFFVVGTSAVVYPAAGLVYTAKRAGSYIVEVNIEETEISSISDISFFGEAGKVLPAILENVKKLKGNI